MRKLFGAVLAVATLLSMVVMTSPAGSAAATPTCNAAKGTFKFTPGLPAALPGIKGVVLSSAGTITSCSGGGVTSGKTAFKSPKSTTASSCTSLAKPDPKSKGTIGSFVVTWNNGKTSTAKAFAIKQTKAIVDATTTGKITSGLFVGKTIKGTVTFKLSVVGGKCVGGTYANKKGVKFTIS